MRYIYVYSIFSSYCDGFCQKLSQYGEKILYTYVYHIVGYLINYEALHEITNLVHEMLSVCAPLQSICRAERLRFALYIDKRNSRCSAEPALRENVSDALARPSVQATLQLHKILFREGWTMDMRGKMRNVVRYENNSIVNYHNDKIYKRISFTSSKFTRANNKAYLNQTPKHLYI